MSKRTIMQRAHEIARETRAKYGKPAHFGECLRMAWAEAKATARRTPKRLRSLLKRGVLSLDEFAAMAAGGVRPSARKRMDHMVREFYWGRVECPCVEDFDRLERLIARRRAG